MKPSILWIVPALVALAGGVIVAKVNAGNDTKVSKTAYNACLAQHPQDVVVCEWLRQASKPISPQVELDRPVSDPE